MHRMLWLPSVTRRWVAAFAGPLLFLLLQWNWPIARLEPQPLPGGAPPAAGVAFEEATPDGTGATAPVSDAEAQRVQHLAQLGATRWHSAGYRGRGIKVAILDSGFRGYREYLGRALPSQVTSRSFRKDGHLEAKDSQHGILCGEVIHALAPEAELLLANWEPDSSEAFLQAVRWARQQGAHILSCSLIMPSWSDGEGGGPVHEALARLLGTGGDRDDLLCFSCAGNTAQRHWSGAFRDSGDGYHEWQSGQKDNRLIPWSEERVSVEVCGQSSAAYDLQVLDQASGGVVGQSLARGRTGASCAVVRFLPQAGHTYALRVRLASGVARPFHVAALGGSLSCVTAHSSIPFPGDGPEVIAVGAVDQDGQRAGYSSCGPNSPQPKPDLVAAVPFPSLWRARAFSGTSAAAPQAAALAALWWSRHPDWTANQVRVALRQFARDLGPAGHDFETGYGLIRLP